MFFETLVKIILSFYYLIGVFQCKVVLALTLMGVNLSEVYGTSLCYSKSIKPGKQKFMWHRISGITSSLLKCNCSILLPERELMVLYVGDCWGKQHDYSLFFQDLRKFRVGIAIYLLKNTYLVFLILWNVILFHTPLFFFFTKTL